jgi:hypothetical protein
MSGMGGDFCSNDGEGSTRMMFCGGYPATSGPKRLNFFSRKKAQKYAKYKNLRSAITGLVQTTTHRHSK